MYVRNYKPGSEAWKKKVIIGRREKVIYEVAVEEQIKIRHHNQLRRRFSEEKVEPNLALDAFKLPTETPTMITANNEEPTSAEEPSLGRSEKTKTNSTVSRVNFFQKGEVLRRGRTSYFYCNYSYSCYFFINCKVGSNQYHRSSSPH